MTKLNKILNKPLEKISKKIFHKTKYGNLKVIFPSERIEYFNSDNKNFNADIKINNFSMISKLMKKGSVGFAESYMDGDFSTNNLTNLLFLAEKNINNYYDYKRGKFIYKFIPKLLHYIKKNTRSGSKQNISYHYDLGNKFYEQWLDKSMTYSSGLFDFPYEDLSKAQYNKYKKMIEPMNLNNDSSLLEIGCGWGGFATFIAKNFGSKIDAITNSKEQFEYTSNKIKNEGLNEKVKVQLKDYRDINNKYDYVFSIEMFEAVGQKFWPVFFDKIKRSLKNNGLATLQIITIDEKKREYYQKNPDFIQQYIFPGGILPSKKQLYQITSTLDLKLDEIINFGNSYANTLKLWNIQFQNSWEQISKQGFSLRFKRMWEYYFAYCEAGFKAKSIDVSHFLLK